MCGCRPVLPSLWCSQCLPRVVIPHGDTQLSIREARPTPARFPRHVWRLLQLRHPPARRPRRSACCPDWPTKPRVHGATYAYFQSWDGTWGCGRNLSGCRAPRRSWFSEAVTGTMSTPKAATAPEEALVVSIPSVGRDRDHVTYTIQVEKGAWGVYPAVCARCDIAPSQGTHGAAWCTCWSRGHYVVRYASLP